MVKKKVEPINVNDQAAMIEANIHPPYRMMRDPNVWTKTPEEKARLKREKHRTIK